MTINGVEFEFNGTKLDSLKKLQDGIENLAPGVLEGQKLMEKGLFYDGAKKQIEAFRQFFLDVTGVDVIGECDDIALATSCFETFKVKMLEQRKKVAEDYARR